PGPSSVAPPPDGTPGLTVVVVSDQFRADYLDRLDGLWTGGIRRLLDEGVVFTEAHHAHAATETGPGHATLSTGAYPATHGIVANDWYDRQLGDTINCVDDREQGDDLVSPSNLLVPTLADQLRRRYPRSRVFAASGKNRGAVLMAGRLGLGAFWFDDEENGYRTGEAYYPDGAPRWFEDLVAAGPSDEWFLDSWKPLPVDPAAAAAAGFSPFDRGPFDLGSFSSQVPGRVVGGFGHRRDEGFFSGLYRTPGLDEWLSVLGREIVEREELGDDEWPDLLSLSFSAVDMVGHGYGHTSLEVLDALLRFDRTLGELFDLLDERLGPDGWAAALSSDHGVVPLAEIEPGEARRVGVAEVVCLRRVGLQLAESYGRDVWLGEGWEGLYLDHEVIRRAGAEVAAVQEELAAAVEECPSVVAASALSELLALPQPAAPPRPGEAGWYLELERRNAHPERSPDVTIRWVEGFNPSLSGRASHGSPYAYDTHVPLVFRIPGVAPARVGEPVETADLAPTLAALLGVEMGDEVDGTDLGEWLRH
ncbi:MAG TPA: alkaline phosphatase family protein, partial [Thermoanaerobaculia bacterium]|nr:alkaline phosphatase family protein [Thermoanaerobaculia bacterium]